jgi:antitoxin HigA-1
MAAAKGLCMKAPAHPGRFVRTVILEPMGLSVTDAARALGVTRVALSRFLNEQASLSPDMAIRLDKAFGADMETLMRMQSSHGIARAKQRQGEISVTAVRGASCGPAAKGAKPVRRSMPCRDRRRPLARAPADRAAWPGGARVRSRASGPRFPCSTPAASVRQHTRRIHPVPSG